MDAQKNVSSSKKIELCDNPTTGYTKEIYKLKN